MSPRAALPHTFERLQVAHVISCFVIPSACSKSSLTLLQALQLPCSSAASHGPWEGYRLLYWYRAILQGYCMLHGTHVLLWAMQEGNINLPDMLLKVTKAFASKFCMSFSPKQFHTMAAMGYCSARPFQISTHKGLAYGHLESTQQAAIGWSLPACLQSYAIQQRNSPCMIHMFQDAQLGPSKFK